MAAYGIDVECPHIFDGTHFARWRNWTSCNFKFISPQMWWIVDVGFSCTIDRKNASQAQTKCLHLDCQATNIFYRSIDSSILSEIIDFASSHEIWVYLNEKYGMISVGNHGEPKMEAREVVEHNHISVVVEDCSTSCSSDQDEGPTTRSLEKMDEEATSDAIDDDTPCTLDGDDDGYESDDSTCSSTSPDCSMSHGDCR